jgi:ArsR family transcriptional regulator
MKDLNQEVLIANLLKVIGVPFRITLLYALEGTESCVCHLEHATGKRQAYISQHLSGLKDAGLVTTRREGKFVFYRVRDPEIYRLLANAEEVLGMTKSPARNWHEQLDTKCTCPKCSG